MAEKRALPLVDEFRTLNWVKIKSDMGFSKIFGSVARTVLTTMFLLHFELYG